MIIIKGYYLFPKLTVKVNNIPIFLKVLDKIKSLLLFLNKLNSIFIFFYKFKFFPENSNNKLTFSYTKNYLHTICDNIINNY